MRRLVGCALEATREGKVRGESYYTSYYTRGEVASVIFFTIGACWADAPTIKIIGLLY
jgi:hypothetical protein